MGQIQWGIRLGAGALAGALLVAACASPNHTQTVNVVQASATATAQSQTAEITSTLSGPGSSPVTERMVYDFQHHLGEVFPSTGPDGQSQSEVILDGSSIYMSLSGFGNGLLAPVPPDLRPKKPWLVQTVPANQTNPTPLAGLFDPTSPSGADMATLLDRLAPVVQSVHQVGTASIGGVETTLYDITLDPQGIREVFGDGAQGAGPSPSGPLALWTDSQGRVRQLQFSLGFSLTGSQMQKITYTIDYSNYGIPVHVTIPPASQVETVQQFMEDEGSTPGNCGVSTPTAPSGQSGSSAIQACSGSASSRGTGTGGTGSAGLLTPSQP
jgi:hypothetical protein